MSKLLVSNYDKKSIPINLERITQLYGHNVELKQYIINSLTKHFSKHKYTYNEKFMENNILIDEEEIGRNYYKSSLYCGISDIKNELVLQKSSLMNEHLKNIMDSFDTSRIMAEFNDFIARLVLDISSNLSILSLDVNVSSKDCCPEDFLKNSLSININDNSHGNCTEYLSNKNALLCFLELLKKIDLIVPQKRLIIMSNLDSYLSCSEYKEIMNVINKISKSHDVTFITSCCTENFCFITEDTVSGINILNDIVFSVPSTRLLADYITDHYPYDRHFKSGELIKAIEPIIHRIGMTTSPLSFESQVILKILNESEHVKTESIKEPNNMEIKYMQNCE